MLLRTEEVGGDVVELPACCVVTVMAVNCESKRGEMNIQTAIELHAGLRFGNPQSGTH